MELNLLSIIFLILGLFVGAIIVIVTYMIRRKNLATKAADMISEAVRKAEEAKNNSLAEIKAESLRVKEETDKEVKERKQELKELEDRLDKRETSLDKREELLQVRSNNLDKKDDDILDKQKKLQDKEEKIDEILKKQMEKLEEISKLKRDKAHDKNMKKVEDSMSLEIADYIKEEEQKAKLNAHEVAKGIIVSAMQRYSADVTNEQTVSTIALPSDDMKGRLIGREGRNIKTIEAVTGVDLIIDDTPEAIVISSFDPLRREIAKITIETLIKDGRIHPTRIEEIYTKTCNDINTKITDLGNNAIYDLGLGKVDAELINIIGRLNYRTSYGQNALQHSMEVAYLCGLMASELGENVSLARRAGLLHDIGKAIDYEVEGSHVELGVMLAKKYHEDEVVINAIASHHGDTEPKSIIAILVQIADTLSAARPGARNDSIENYVKRLEQLETIGNSFEGVEKTYAMQAGREVRVMVKPEEIDDAKARIIARNMKEKIEPHKYLIEIAQEVMRELGVEPIVLPIRGGTDGARLSYEGLPCPNLCTGGYNFHGRYEYICIQDMKKISEILVKIAGNFGKI